MPTDVPPQGDADAPRFEALAIPPTHTLIISTTTALSAQEADEVHRQATAVHPGPVLVLYGRGVYVTDGRRAE